MFVSVITTIRVCKSTAKVDQAAKLDILCPRVV